MLAASPPKAPKGRPKKQELLHPAFKPLSDPRRPKQVRQRNQGEQPEPVKLQVQPILLTAEDWLQSTQRANWASQHKLRSNLCLLIAENPCPHFRHPCLQAVLCHFEGRKSRSQHQTPAKAAKRGEKTVDCPLCSSSMVRLHSSASILLRQFFPTSL